MATRSCWLPSEIGAILRTISPPGYTACGPPRSNLTDPRDRDTLHFDFTAGGSGCGRGGFSGCRGLRLVAPGRVGRPSGRFLVLGAGLACGAAVFLLACARVAWWVPLCKYFMCCGRGPAVRLHRAPVGPPSPARVSSAAVVSREGGAALDAGGFPGAHTSVCRGGLGVALRWWALRAGPPASCLPQGSIVRGWA